MSILAPSTLARRIAGSDHCWPDVQSQRKGAPGVFGFSCAGHGGIIGIVPAMKVDAEHEHLVHAARVTGKIVPYVVMRNGRQTQVHPLYVFDYKDNGEVLDYWRRHFEVEDVEVWIGEEDCDWATIATVPGVLEGLVKAGYLSQGVTLADVFGSLTRWNTDFALAAGI